MCVCVHARACVFHFVSDYGRIFFVGKHSTNQLHQEYVCRIEKEFSFVITLNLNKILFFCPILVPMWLFQ